MKRRNFIKLTAGLAGTSLLPISIKTYSTPIWNEVNKVNTMKHTMTLFCFNLCVKEGSVVNTYVRQMALFEAAKNITEQDIINEFYTKYFDDSALITTVGAEGNYYLDERFEGSFRAHLTVGQVKEFIKKMNRLEKYDYRNMDEYQRVDARISYKYKTWISNNAKGIHKIYDDGKEVYKEFPLYSIEIFAKEHIKQRDLQEEWKRKNDMYSKSNLRKKLISSLQS